MGGSDHSYAFVLPPLPTLEVDAVDDMNDEGDNKFKEGWRITALNLRSVMGVLLSIRDRAFLDGWLG